MAQEPEVVAEETPEKPAKKGKKRLLVIIAVVLLLAAAGGGAWHFMKGGGEPAPAEAKSEPAAPPVFVPLETFTVNLRGGSGAGGFLQTNITLKVHGPDVEANLKEHSPAVRNAVLLLLSSKTVDELSSVEGKQQLAGDILTSINALLPGGTPPPAPATAAAAPDAPATDASAAAATPAAPATDAPAIAGMPSAPAAAPPAASPAAPSGLAAKIAGATKEPEPPPAPVAKPAQPRAPVPPNAPVQDVLFTSFIIQP